MLQPSRMHVMVDLETMSTHGDAAILSVGAVKFDPWEEVGVLGDPDEPEYVPFYEVVSLPSCMARRMHVDGYTVAWWMQQPEEARLALFGNKVETMPLESMLGHFYAWFGMESLPTWGNGAAFDCVILRTAYQRIDASPPFKYQHERCYRTIRALAPELPFSPPELAHHALSDAEAQAVHLQKLFRHLNLKRS